MHDRYEMPSVDFGRAEAGLEEVEVAPLVGLSYVLREAGFLENTKNGAGYRRCD